MTTQVGKIESAGRWGWCVFVCVGEMCTVFVRCRRPYVYRGVLVSVGGMYVLGRGGMEEVGRWAADHSHDWPGRRGCERGGLCNGVDE